MIVPARGLEAPHAFATLVLLLFGVLALLLLHFSAALAARSSLVVLDALEPLALPVT